MAQQLVTYKDLHDYCMEEANLNTSDTNASNRVNRLINIVYEDVSMQERWRWLEKAGSTVVPTLYKTGSVSISNNSATLTGNASVSFASSMVGRHVFLEGESAEYKISSVTDATNLVFTEVYRGPDISAGAYRIYQREYLLDTDCEEVFNVYHTQSNNLRYKTRKALDRQTMLNYQLSTPSRESFAEYWTHGDWTTSGTRRLEVWPPGDTTQDYRLRYKYVRRISSLSATSDVPLMPRTYRSVLAYGALQQIFIQQGNVQRAAWAQQMYQRKLDGMLNDLEVTDRSLTLKTQWKGRRRTISPVTHDLGSAFDDDSWIDD